MKSYECVIYLLTVYGEAVWICMSHCLFPVCNQVPIGDHSVISTVKQTGCYIVSRSMYSKSPHRSLSWSLNISSITENSVIVLQQYKKPKVTKSSNNNVTCLREEDKLICEMGRFDKSPIYISNRNHKSAFLNFSYPSDSMKPSEVPIDFEGKDVLFSTFVFYPVSGTFWVLILRKYSEKSVFSSINSIPQ